MNYTDIKDQVVEITNSLELLPVHLLEHLMERHWGVSCFMDTSEVKALRHPSITCITHLYMPLHLDLYHCVSTIKVDDMPAFFFVAGPVRGQMLSKESPDYNNYYILDSEVTRAFVRCLVSMSLEKALEDTDLAVVEESQHIPGIPEFTQP